MLSLKEFLFINVLIFIFASIGYCVVEKISGKKPDFMKALKIGVIAIIGFKILLDISSFIFRN